MSLKSLPQLGDSSWGIPLNMHIAQLQNPTNGAINSFDEFSQRPINLTADDQGKTYIYIQTGNFHQWTGTAWKILNQTVVNVKDYGAIGDGAIDDTIKIQALINTGVAEILFPKGKYRITTELKLAGPLVLTGDSGNWYPISGLANDFEQSSKYVSFYCNQIVGYLFNTRNTNHKFSISGIFFDGSNGQGYPNISETWQGLITNSDTSGSAVQPYYFILERVGVAFSNSITPAINLLNFTMAQINMCKIYYWPNGIGIQITGQTTTVSIIKSYFNYSKQNISILGSVSDITIRDCIFESSVTAISCYGSILTLYSCYFENIGYDVYGRNAQVNLEGLVPRSFNIGNFSDVTGNVKAVVTVMYTIASFYSCTFRYKNTSGGQRPWFEGLGRSLGAGYTGGSATFYNCSFYDFNSKVFENSLPGDENYAICYYSYEPISIVGSNILPLSEVRKITKGNANIKYGTNKLLHCSIANGKLTFDANPDNEYAKMNIPVNGVHEIGDIIHASIVSAGSYQSYICISDGTSTTPGVWKGFGLIQP
jgi:Pectate lyase superfamily protein